MVPTRITANVTLTFSKRGEKEALQLACQGHFILIQNAVHSLLEHIFSCFTLLIELYKREKNCIVNTAEVKLVARL